MVIPNIVTKFQNFEIFEHFVTFFTVVCSSRLLHGECYQRGKGGNREMLVLAYESLMCCGVVVDVHFIHAIGITTLVSIVRNGFLYITSM